MDLTEIFQAASSGDKEARSKMIQLAYDELKRIASARMKNQRLDHSLGATALVNEATLKILNDSHLSVKDSSHFYTYASKAMRNLLIDHARTKGRQKRGGELKKFSFVEAMVACDQQSEDFLALNEALDRLATIKPRCAQVVELRYFGGMSNQEVADALTVSLATVKRDWIVAKSWLMCELQGDSAVSKSGD